MICVPAQLYLLFSHFHLDNPDQEQNQYFHFMGRRTACAIQSRKKFQKSLCSPEDKSYNCVFQLLQTLIFGEIKQGQATDSRFWMKTQTGLCDVEMMWRGEEHSMQYSPSADITEYLKTYTYTVHCWKLKGPTLDLEIKLRSDQSSSWKSAGQNLALKAYFLILALVLIQDMNFGNCLHLLQGNWAPTFLLYGNGLLNVWCRVEGCINYGHHFITLNNSRWNLYII